MWYDKTTGETSWEEFNDLAQRTLLVQGVDHVEKTCLSAVLEFEGRLRDVTETFRIVDDFATELQRAIRRCQVFRFEFDLMSAYNGNCPNAPLMTTKDVMNKMENEGFAGVSLPRILQRKMKLVSKLKAFEPMFALDHLSKLIRSGNWTVQ